LKKTDTMFDIWPVHVDHEDVHQMAFVTSGESVIIEMEMKLRSIQLWKTYNVT